MTDAGGMNRRPSRFDLGVAIDSAPWSPWQRRCTLLAALAILGDGFDNQALSFVLPQLMEQWGLPREAFAALLASGLIGVSIGAVAAGWISDRHGRRPVLIGSTLLFGIGSLLMAASQSMTQMILLRLVSSIGMGGAMPVAGALVSEYAPPRLRTLAVTLTVVCLPLGGMLSGLVAGAVHESSGWRGLFVVGGVLGIGIALTLARWLPESIRFLTRVPERWPEAAALGARMALQVPADAELHDSTERPRVAPALGALLSPGLRRRTLLLAVAFACALFGMQLTISWLPALLTARRFDGVVASLALSAFNFGGVLGTVAFGLFGVALNIGRATAVALVGAAAVALTLAVMDVTPGTAQGELLIALLALNGLFAHASLGMLSALGTFVFPTGVRASGSGATVAFGRVVAALASAWLGAWLIAYGTGAYFATVAAACLATALLVVWLMREPADSGAAQLDR